MSASTQYLLQWITLIIGITQTISQNPTCRPCIRPNEIYVRERTCQRMCNNLDEVCASVGNATTKSCHCKNGYARDETSTCMPIKDCENRLSGNCGSNEDYRCDNFCEFECRKVSNPCPKFFNCLKGCFCTLGYFRNATGSCVQSKDCTRCQLKFKK